MSSKGNMCLLLQNTTVTATFITTTTTSIATKSNEKNFKKYINIHVIKRTYQQWLIVLT